MLLASDAQAFEVLDKDINKTREWELLFLLIQIRYI